MTAAQRVALFEAAERIARALGPEFTGQIEVNVHKGSAGSVAVHQTIKRTGT